MNDMNDKQIDIYDENLLVEAEILSAWAPLIGLKNHDITVLVKSIIFKLNQSHYHLLQALRNSTYSQEKILSPIHINDRFFYDFATTCNIDSMIYALNSIMDIINKLILIIYKEIKGPKPEYFTDMMNSKYYKSLSIIDPTTANIMKSIFKLSERKYVNRYCNDNKHKTAFFSAGAYFDYDIDKHQIIKGHTLKKRYTRSKEDKEIEDYAPKLDKTHREKICELGKSILTFKGLEPFKVDDNMLKYLKMTSNNYFR